MTKKHNEGEAKNVVATVLKWAGGITALLSLVFAVQRLTEMISEDRDRLRTTDELYQTGKLQQSSLDYAAAWKSFEAGLQAAARGGHIARLTGRLDKEQRRFREAQENLAMEWLENISVNPERGESFASAVAPLAAVLSRGITSAKGQRKADLLAHFAWSNFLRGRSGEGAPALEPQYKEALQLDSLNPYAHAYLAHWKLWNNDVAALPLAKQHFAAALRSGRARADVRSKQIAAISNLGSDGDLELLRVVSDMRKSNDSIDGRIKSHIYGEYWQVCHRYWDGSPDAARMEAIRTAIPLAEHDALFTALFADFDPERARERDACRATLHEKSGEREEALRIWTELRKSQADDRTWRGYADAAIRRLSAPQPSQRR